MPSTYRARSFIKKMRIVGSDIICLAYHFVELVGRLLCGSPKAFLGCVRICVVLFYYYCEY